MKKQKKKKKNESITEWYRCGKCRVMGKNADSLSFREVEAVEYFNYRA